MLVPDELMDCGVSKVSKNILVSTKFMCEVLMLTSYLHSEDDINLDEAKCLCLPLETYINDKCERMERRKIFTNYKTTPPSPERESFRKDYIISSSLESIEIGRVNKKFHIFHLIVMIDNIDTAYTRRVSL